MINYTTPTITLTIEGKDITDADIYVSLEQRDRKMTPEEFIEYELKSDLPMELGKFLVPEVCGYLGFTIRHLEKLRPLVERLDARHSYEKIIFDSYIENGDFTLTNAQRASAFFEYKRARNE